MVDRNTAPAAPPNHDRLGSTHRFMDSDQSLLKVTQSLGHSLPGGYIVVRIDDEGERILYVRKGVDRLKEVTQQDQLCEVARRHHHDRENNCHLSVGHSKSAEADLLLHNLSKVGEHIAKALVKEAEFDWLRALTGHGIPLL